MHLLTRPTRPHWSIRDTTRTPRGWVGLFYNEMLVAATDDPETLPALYPEAYEPEVVVTGSGSRAYSTFAPADLQDADQMQAVLEGR